VIQGQVEIPNKSSFKLNEVCALTGVRSYVLRFWESEFSEISPLISSSGHKLYEHRDIESILLIKKLLFDDKMTIEKAKAEMKILMPRESLVERGFSDNFSFEDLEELDDEETTLDSQSQVHDLSRENMTKRVLIESDLKKLTHAKNKLVEILKLTEALHQKNQW